MPESILTILKFCFLGLLYLFLVRVLSTIDLELSWSREEGRARFPGFRRRGEGGRRNAPDGTRGRGLRLKMIEPATAETFPLGEEMTIGRAPGCSVPLADDTFASQLHARIYVREGQPFVEDLGSTNGTFLNRDRVSATMPLRRGDKLQIGETILEVV
ncbi:MAG: FHA domain-containing protein [Acidimicrobiia bacterium]